VRNDRMAPPKATSSGALLYRFDFFATHRYCADGVFHTTVYDTHLAANGFALALEKLLRGETN